jgi:hypothetical protein
MDRAFGFARVTPSRNAKIKARARVQADIVGCWVAPDAVGPLRAEPVRFLPMAEEVHATPEQMRDELHNQLLRNTEELRGLVGRCSTEEVVGMCATHHLPGRVTGKRPSGLLSPGRQPLFLLGLMLTTPEPQKPMAFGRDKWQRSIRLLNDIFLSYTRYMPKADEQRDVSREKWRAPELAISAFLDYFNNPILAQPEQVSQRVKAYLSPFDAELRRGLGTSASEALEIAYWIAKRLFDVLQEWIMSGRRLKKESATLCDRAQAQGWSIERLLREAQQGHYFPSAEGWRAGFHRLFKVTLQSLREQFRPELADPYWRFFVSRRGEVREFRYLTDSNVAEHKPLFETAEGVAMCPIGNQLLHAILKAGEGYLLAAPARDSFLKKRDKVLQQEVEQAFRTVFGSSAEYVAGGYETATLHYEHDLTVRWQNRLFLVEAKASPPVEPFRDPNKAFTRIKRHFASERGIQKAYDQANRLRRRLTSGETVKLYDRRRSVVMTIRPEETRKVYIVCVTRDSFGPLAVDLSQLLEKGADEDYPWALNILDLQSLVDAWGYFGWGPEKLCEYLDTRTKLHGKLSVSDELEIAGFFIKHGRLDYLVQETADLMCLTPDYSEVFDRIRSARRGGPEVVYSPTKPFFGDLRKILAEPVQCGAGGALNNWMPEIVKKQGRNEPCACGSGKKFKHCCGRGS